ncbi:TadE family protein [Sediminivirga luteola]|uniref:TadE-like domain-containing protein n=1 Tax=Sediminivirga luteola TaxID=1774748 RepID=A0A8J2TY29_9MICO|nr:TadE family protein [Sediminivirga luteola]GGA14948.1 hypothetical protein GCM10011333_17450 [Sediminivirga luteola]
MPSTGYAARDSDRGSAVAEFALLSAMLVLVFLVVAQLALALHVRNTLIDSAAAGARLAAMGDRSLEEGERRTAELIATALHEGYARDIEARIVTAAGVEVVEVTVRAPVPLAGLLGPPETLQLRGRALVEDVRSDAEPPP